MDVLLKRIAALLVGRLIGLLGRWGVGGISSEQTGALEGWVVYSLEVLLNLGVSGAWSRLRPPAEERKGESGANL